MDLGIPGNMKVPKIPKHPHKVFGILHTVKISRFLKFLNDFIYLSILVLCQHSFIAPLSEVNLTTHPSPLTALRQRALLFCAHYIPLRPNLK